MTPYPHRGAAAAKLCKINLRFIGLDQAQKS